MKTLIAAVCFMFALSPLAMAQDKGGAAGNPPAAAKLAKKAPSEKQLAQRAKMKACSGEAKEKKLKGAELKKFRSTCLKG